MSVHIDELVIHDGNSSDVHDWDGRGKGLIPRDYGAIPVGSIEGVPAMRDVNIPLIPRSEWSARIKEMEETKSRLSDLRLIADAGKPFPSLDQGPIGYCWAHSTVHAVMYLRAVNGSPYIPLSAYAVAATIKNGADEGGWGALSLDFIQKRGVPDQKYWPQGSRSLRNGTPECWANAALHKVTAGWIETDAAVYDRDLSFDQVMTLLLCRVPVVGDFNWWGHSVCLIDPVEVEPGSFGVRIQNSWGDRWTQNSPIPGTGILQGNKAIPDGAVAPRTVTASVA